MNKNIHALTEDQKEPFLADAKALSCKELAAKYSCSMSTVRSYVRQWTGKTYSEYQGRNDPVRWRGLEESCGRLVEEVYASYLAKVEAAKRRRERQHFIRQAAVKERPKTKIIPAAEKPCGYIW